MRCFYYFRSSAGLDEFKDSEWEKDRKGDYWFIYLAIIGQNSMLKHVHILKL